ncbi:hypothetical protein [Acinetobacter haemolyticus]|uniref:hypothetical protein n=1 Tax=Acinetobacter haemolyticus TaxID=29430 RepID=UPI003F5659F4
MLDLILLDILEISKSSFKLDKKYYNNKITKFSIHVDNLSTNDLYFHWRVGEESLLFIDKALRKGAFVITSEEKYKK